MSELPHPHKSFSAGGVVLNAKGDVLVVNQRGNSWSLPKGHLDPGETARQAAEREIHEESGVNQLTYVRDLGAYERPRIGKHGGDDTVEVKHLTFFLFTTPQMELKPIDPHNPEARWVNPQKVAELLSHPRDKEFFQAVLPLLTASR